jgi:hypothetical protein
MQRKVDWIPAPEWFTLDSRLGKRDVVVGLTTSHISYPFHFTRMAGTKAIMTLDAQFCID